MLSILSSSSVNASTSLLYQPQRWPCELRYAHINAAIAVDVVPAAASFALCDSVKLKVTLNYGLKRFLRYLIRYPARHVLAVYARAGTLSSREDFYEY